MFIKLSFKIGFLFFVFILIIESLLFFVLYTNIANERIEDVLDNLLARANTHSEVLELNLNESTLEHVGIMESASDFVVVITDELGNVINHSDTIQQEMRPVLEAVNYNANQTEGRVVEDRWDDKQYIAAESPVNVGGDQRGHVFMFADTADVKKNVNQLSNQFIVIALLTFGLTIITIFILSRFITYPLIKMKEATEQLSLGRNKVELHTDRKDELGELAKSITKLANELDQLKTARNEFLASISHELRTPLTYIKGYADIINRQDITESEVKEYTTIIREESEHLSILIRNLFELAKMDRNRFTIQREEVSLHELIHSIADRIKPAFAEKNINFTINCPENTVAFVDPERFEQVLVNILDNAKKHSSEGTNVQLEVSQIGKEVIVAITDEGEGIPNKDLPYVFDRLYRVEKSRSRQSGGSGLGLTIAKEIIEAHGGQIEIKSEQGEGTSVIIRLIRGGNDV
ncbi:HAMP domain-containing protein [Virgibacillus subterraneus]|uniref:histidine kinase n=1 Tax=Virgibacillus subterraneus TaxID=621109 RepID=A0A1H9K9E2_9BACI|nr:HAMP domain-containing sensor histidine kinase [Virgibacillus subterraneus]SEQ95744.1 HAMP domain-containing protein [Virgibacillus subterraneus]